MNVARRLTDMAARLGDQLAVAAPRHTALRGPDDYQRMTFRELEADSNRIASGLVQMGVTPGTRLALLVRAGVDFVSLVFALFKAGAVSILIDPGMGRKNLIACLEQVTPEGFVAIPPAQAVRTVLARRFPRARFNVTVGRRWFWGGKTLAGLRAIRRHARCQAATAAADDPAAIIFTTGSTGPPKGVLYRHGNFDAQVAELQASYGIQPGEIDLAGFPLFGLFNGALGVTTIVPDMDPTRPAAVDPPKLLAAIRDWEVTQSFGSPADLEPRWPALRTNRRANPTAKRVLSAGAPVPAHVLQRMRNCLPADAEIHTPYGATESLPVASIAASEVLGETQARTRVGGGVCVGRHFPQHPLACDPDQYRLDRHDRCRGRNAARRNWRADRQWAGRDVANMSPAPSGTRWPRSRMGPTSGTGWATSVTWISRTGSGFADGWPIACSRLPAPCTPFPAKRFSIAIRPCSAPPWSAWVRRAASGPC